MLNVTEQGFAVRLCVHAHRCVKLVFASLETSTDVAHYPHMASRSAPQNFFKIFLNDFANRQTEMPAKTQRPWRRCMQF